MTRKIAALTIAAGGILYAAWFLQWIVPTDLSAASSYISELSADDQPSRWVFRACDLASGSLLVVGSIAALRSTVRTRWALAGWISLALFGLSTISDSQTPLPCAATSEPHCERLSDLGQLGIADSLHTVTSAGQDFFFGLTMVCLMVVAFRIDMPNVLRRLASGVAIAVVAAWAWTLTAAAEFELSFINDHLGVAQRTEVTLMGTWLVLVSVALLRVRRPATRPPPPPAPRFDGFDT